MGLSIENKDLLDKLRRSSAGRAQFRAHMRDIAKEHRMESLERTVLQALRHPDLTDQQLFDLRDTYMRMYGHMRAMQDACDYLFGRDYLLSIDLMGFNHRPKR